MTVAGSSAGQARPNASSIRRAGGSYNRRMQRSDVVLGPLFTVGAVLLCVGVLRRSWLLGAAGAAAIYADQQLPVGRWLKEAFSGT
jgi:hypothetical protein